jgi:tRNA U34 5-methylaminomethyl-2-thiouridine-forming methyltransferase MnmC
MHIEIKKTADGSSTLYVPELNEHYHSMHGAVSESMHVFIRMGLDKILKPSMMILEIGFGTGLNAILTLLEAGTLKQIQYDCIETGPLTRDQVIALGYENYLHLSAGQREHFLQMHTCTWGERISITNSFSLRKMKVSLQDLEVDNSYDLVYFDAFAPRVQPELWEESIFSKLYLSMGSGGILVTYCAKGEVRRCMQRAGFEVERLPGPPGKREMLRAKKTRE